MGRKVERTVSTRAGALLAAALRAARATAPGLGGVFFLLLSGSQACAEDLYLDPDWIKAMIRVETDYNQAEYLSDPMQLNKPADWSAYKGKIGLTKGVAPGADVGVTAGLGVLNARAYRVDASGKHLQFRGWKEATQRYNGGGDPQYLEKVEKAYQDIKNGR